MPSKRATARLAGVADRKEASLDASDVELLMVRQASALSLNNLSRSSPLTPCAPATAASAILRSPRSPDAPSLEALSPSAGSSLDCRRQLRRRQLEAIRRSAERHRPHLRPALRPLHPRLSASACWRFLDRLFGRLSAPRPALPRPRASSARRLRRGLLGRTHRHGSASAVGSAVAASRPASATTALSLVLRQRRRLRRLLPPCVARSSARSLAFSPGSPFFGLLRAARSRTPAASRKRRTRSDGWAPTLSQCWMRSASSLTRSGESFASSGL